MPLEPELRFRDMEQRLAEGSITAEPAPIDQAFPDSRLVTVNEKIQLLDSYAEHPLGEQYLIVNRNHLTNPNFRENLTNWMVSSGVSRGPVIEENRPTEADVIRMTFIGATFDVSGRTNDEISQQVVSSPGTTVYYEALASLKVKAGNGRMTIGVRALDAMGSVLQTDSTTV